MAGRLALRRWFSHGLVVPQSSSPAGDVHLLMNSARNTLFNRDVNFTAADSSKVRERSPLPPPQPRPIPVRQCHGPTLPLAPISFKHIILTRPNVHETRLCRARETNHASFLASIRLSHNHVAVSTPSLRRPSQAGEPNQVILNSRPHSFLHAGGPPSFLRIWPPCFRLTNSWRTVS